ALPPQVLSSIAAYYRRVTTEAAPMSGLISLVMLATLAAIVAELVLGDRPSWRAILSLVLALFAIGLAGARIVRNAKTLGAGEGAPEARSSLARGIYRDHLWCLAAMASVTGLQLLV
ncbi:MAG TPA: hypothetical protein VFW13_10700, partial [Phenylobacterium sp.]|nr:hypothetical protein [Phenylobacterium sp.]